MVSNNLFPLLARLGLKVYGNLVSQYVDAADLEKVLQRAATVYGEQPDGEYLINPSIEKFSTDTHQGLVVGVEPITKESAADILRDAVKAAYSPPDNNWLERAIEWEKANPK